MSRLHTIMSIAKEYISNRDLDFPDASRKYVEDFPKVNRVDWHVV